MTDDTVRQVQTWIDRLNAGDAEAANHLMACLRDRWLAFARRALHGSHQRLEAFERMLVERRDADRAVIQFQDGVREAPPVQLVEIALFERHAPVPCIETCHRDGPARKFELCKRMYDRCNFLIVTAHDR